MRRACGGVTEGERLPHRRSIDDVPLQAARVLAQIDEVLEARHEAGDDQIAPCRRAGEHRIVVGDGMAQPVGRARVDGSRPQPRGHVVEALPQRVGQRLHALERLDPICDRGDDGQEHQHVLAQRGHGVGGTLGSGHVVAQRRDERVERDGAARQAQTFRLAVAGG